MAATNMSLKSACTTCASAASTDRAPWRNLGRWPALWLLLLMVFSGGCMQIDIRHNTPGLYPTLQTEDVKGAIERMEQRLAAAPHDPSQARLRFQLAVLYAHHRNPAPNYAKANALLEQYLAVKARAAPSNEVLYLQALLGQIERQEEHLAELQRQVTASQDAADRLANTNQRLQSQLDALQQSNQSLEADNQHLEQENQTMRAMIEQLKRLDVHMEKKRQALDQP